MGSFSDLPRYPAESVDKADGPSEADGAVRGAITIAQIVGELLIIAAPIFAWLWWIVCLPVLVALVVEAERDNHH